MMSANVLPNDAPIEIGSGYIRIFNSEAHFTMGAWYIDFGIALPVSANDSVLRDIKNRMFIDTIKREHTCLRVGPVEAVKLYCAGEIKPDHLFNAVLAQPGLMVRNVDIFGRRLLCVIVDPEMSGSFKLY